MSVSLSIRRVLRDSNAEVPNHCPGPQEPKHLVQLHARKFVDAKLNISKDAASSARCDRGSQTPTKQLSLGA